VVIEGSARMAAAAAHFLFACESSPKRNSIPVVRSTSTPLLP